MSSTYTEHSEQASTRYSLSVDDLVAFNRHLAFTHNPYLKRRFWILSCFWSVLTGIAYGWITVRGRAHIGPGVVVGVVVAVVFLVPYWLGYRYSFGRHLRHLYEASPSDHQTGFRTLLLTDDGIREVTGHTEAFFRWHTIRAVAGAPDHVFIYVGGSQAIVVPRPALTPPLVESLRSHVALDLFTGSPLLAA